MTARANRRLLGAGLVVAAGAAAGAAAHRALQRRIAADPENERLRSPAAGSPRTVRSADGTVLHVERFGPERGDPIVLFHGWTETIGFWTYVTGELEQRGFRVLGVDLRGHGESGRAPGGDYSLERFGDDVEAVLESCLDADERAVVVGHSLGAMSIAAWAEHHDVTRRARAAALLNTGVGDLVNQQLLFPVLPVAQAVSRTIAVRGVLGARAPLPRFSTPLSHAAIRYAAFGPTASPAQVAFYERMLLACAPDVRADIGIAMSEMDLHHALERLTLPTLVVAGENDRLTPPTHARKIADMLPQLHELVMLPETGHMGPLERPHEITEKLVALAETAAPARSVAV
jgi:pimeloyl-ACP methyl ester carboxylesterase